MVLRCFLRSQHRTAVSALVTHHSFLITHHSFLITLFSASAPIPTTSPSPMRIGVQVPSATLQALASRHLNDNMRGYPVLDEGSRDLIDAVARGDVDIAIMWGPQAGYFARAQRASLDLVPVMPQIDPPFLPFVFDISMGVRRGDVALKEKLDREIERRQSDIDRILDQYGVPRV